MNIGNAIRDLRKGRNLNQRNFAKMVGITQGYLSQVEHGKKKPSLEVLELMAKDLSVPLPVMLWFSVNESDIATDKIEAYRALKDVVDSLIKSII